MWLCDGWCGCMVAGCGCVMSVTVWWVGVAL